MTTPEQLPTMGRVLFEAREASRMKRYGWRIEWDSQVAEVQREYEEVAAAVVAEGKRRGL